MTARSTDMSGNEIIYNESAQRWEYLDGTLCPAASVAPEAEKLPEIKCKGDSYVWVKEADGSMVRKRIVGMTVEVPNKGKTAAPKKKKAYEHIPSHDPRYREEYECQCPEYDLLVGPDGFKVLLTEPKDRTWYRDGAPVIERLNEQHERIEAAIKMLRYWENTVPHCPGMVGKVLAVLERPDKQ